MIDTDSFTIHERDGLLHILHQLLIDSRVRNPLSVTQRGLEGQVAFLGRLYGEDAAVDFVLGALDTVDERLMWERLYASA